MRKSYYIFSKLELEMLNFVFGASQLAIFFALVYILFKGI